MVPQNRAEAWNEELTSLAEEGIIPKEQAEKMIESGPNPLLIEQALSVESWTKLHQKRQEFAAKERRIRDVEAAKEEGRNSREALTEKGRDARAAVDDARLDKKADADIKRIQSIIDKNRRTGGKGGNEDGLIRDEIKASLEAKRKALKLDNEFGPADPAAAEQEFEDYRTRVFKHFGYGPDGRRLKGGVALEAEGDGDGTSAASAARPASKADYDALPSGSYFVNPADGKLKRKP